MPLSSDLRIIKDKEKKPEGRVVLSLREYAVGPAERDAAPETGAEGEAEAGEGARAEPEAEAEAEAQSAVVVARIEADRIRETARLEGYREGYAEGRREAERAGRETRARAQTVLRQAEDVRAQTLEALEPEVLELAVDIARRLVAEQLTLAPETIRAVVGSALERVRNRERFVVYAHPGDASILEAHPEDFQGLTAAEAEVRIIADEDVQAGGCRIETERGVVDATLQSRWRALLKALYKEG